jgi:hypothetical protein
MNEHILSTFLAPLVYTLTNSYAGPLFCQGATTLNKLNSNQPFHYSPFIMSTCSKELEKHRKEEEAMAAVMLQKEKVAADRLQQEEESKVAAALASSVTKEVHQMDVTEATLPPVVSPPLAPNLTSLLTGHVGREGETVPENSNTSTAADTAADDIGKSPRIKTKNPNPIRKEMLLSAIVAALP